ncbi:MAG: peptide deformylase [Myxococcales bacterium]|nr:peptide deformylase [Myxococcales bacterium]|tara:strand:- start:816 stop:1391 length:576 start_codon:yes stop_codon:yes gene_type:complete
MAVRKICIWPDPALSEIAKPVEKVDDSIAELVQDLFDTMYEAHGVGLAATQIAVAQQVLVIDLDPSGEAVHDEDYATQLKEWGFKGPQAFVNPEIVTCSGSIFWEEGCLSVPGISEKVKRSDTITVKAQNEKGEDFELSVSGLYAVAIQHEMDHLVGKVFVEYLSKLKRDVVKRKMLKLKTQTDDGVAAAL